MRLSGSRNAIALETTRQDKTDVFIKYINLTWGLRQMILFREINVAEKCVYHYFLITIISSLHTTVLKPLEF